MKENFVITEAIARALLNESKKTGAAKGEIIRRALMEYLTQRGHKLEAAQVKHGGNRYTPPANAK